MNDYILLPSFISELEEVRLIDFIDAQDWNTTLKRRTQHYGYEYSYTSGVPLKPTRAIPLEFKFLIERLNMKEDINQIIVNEYQPGQGISPHTDHVRMFGSTIVSLSLGSQCIMDFQLASSTIPILLLPRSCIILNGDSRYKWKHSIASRKTDVIDGIITERTRRVSITFRHAIT